MEWEQLGYKADNFDTMVMEMPGGWLVKNIEYFGYDSNREPKFSMVYVPDPDKKLRKKITLERL